MFRSENITSQVDGVRDTFTTQQKFVPSSLTLVYNGQTFPAGVNIKQILGNKTFRLDFVPASDTSFLMVMYEDGAGNGNDDITGKSQPPRTT